MITNCLPFAISISVTLTFVLLCFGIYRKKQFLTNSFTDIIFIISSLLILATILIASKFPEETRQQVIPVKVLYLKKSIAFLNQHNRTILLEVPINNFSPRKISYHDGHLIYKYDVNFLGFDLTEGKGKYSFVH